jgi:hypothetical protein
MHMEYIRACHQWWNRHARNDCVFISMKPELEGMQGFDIAHILCFFFLYFSRNDLPLRSYSVVWHCWWLSWWGHWDMDCVASLSC